jgi:hypothetical protein
MGNGTTPLFPRHDRLVAFILCRLLSHAVEGGQQVGAELGRPRRTRRLRYAFRDPADDIPGAAVQGRHRPCFVTSPVLHNLVSAMLGQHAVFHGLRVARLVAESDRHVQEEKRGVTERGPDLDGFP